MIGKTGAFLRLLYISLISPIINTLLSNPSFSVALFAKWLAYNGKSDAAFYMVF